MIMILQEHGILRYPDSWICIILQILHGRLPLMMVLGCDGPVSTFLTSKAFCIFHGDVDGRERSGVDGGI